MSLKSTYTKTVNGKTYICNHKEYHHVCKCCGKEFVSYKKNQVVCSKECGAKLHYSNQLGKNNHNDECFFNNVIDTEHKAYLLGLLTADGSISCNKISISLTDKHMIETINLLINPERKIYKNNDSYMFYWNNQEDLEFLKNIGFTTTKQYNACMYKNIPENLMNHYIRGWFDGDGCVYESTTVEKAYDPPRKYTYKLVSFTTGSEIAKDELNMFFKNLGIDSKIVKDSRSNSLNRNNTYYVKIYKKKHVEFFKNYIYKNATIMLTRKYNKFMR